MPLGTKPLPEPMLTLIYVTIWHYKATMSQLTNSCQVYWFVKYTPRKTFKLHTGCTAKPPHIFTKVPTFSCTLSYSVPQRHPSKERQNGDQARRALQRWVNRKWFCEKQMNSQLLTNFHAPKRSHVNLQSPICTHIQGLKYQFQVKYIAQQIGLK